MAIPKQRRPGQTGGAARTSDWAHRKSLGGGTGGGGGGGKKSGGACLVWAFGLIGGALSAVTAIGYGATRLLS